MWVRWWRLRMLGGAGSVALTPVVVSAAEDGDATAAEVLEQAGEGVARQVAVVWEKMRRHGETTGRVAYTGSVVEKIVRVRAAMREALAEKCTGLQRRIERRRRRRELCGEREKQGLGIRAKRRPCR